MVNDDEKLTQDYHEETDHLTFKERMQNIWQETKIRYNKEHIEDIINNPESPKSAKFADEYLYTRSSLFSKLFIKLATKKIEKYYGNEDSYSIGRINYIYNNCDAPEDIGNITQPDINLSIEEQNKFKAGNDQLQNILNEVMKEIEDKTIEKMSYNLPKALKETLKQFIAAAAIKLKQATVDKVKQAPKKFVDKILKRKEGDKDKGPGINQ